VLGRKQFVLERKNQRTLALTLVSGVCFSGRARPLQMRQEKSFLLLFFKKEGLPS
jgi:hypothetical protein